MKNIIFLSGTSRPFHNSLAQEPIIKNVTQQQVLQILETEKGDKRD